LLSGALGAGVIVAAALYFGLVDQGERARSEPEVQAALGGPPETIANAPGDYETSDLTIGELTPPRDELWLETPTPREAPREPPSDAVWDARARDSGEGGPSQPNPIETARASAIMFEREGDRQTTTQESERLETQLTPPRSRYELIAGAVIPAALITELNSDQPGRALAQVTQNVFDSVSGAYLLIPQGARLIGTYDSATTYGDQRLTIVWNRLILPNGWSISLRGMEGTDATGAAGLRDRTDNHLGRLAGAIGLSAIISVIADNAENEEDNTFSQSVGDAAATEAAQTGSRIVERDLAVAPTLRIRAGGAVRVLVTRDIALRPYREAGAG
jgi:type IV secretion system protein VirB10